MYFICTSIRFNKKIFDHNSRLVLNKIKIMHLLYIGSFGGSLSSLKAHQLGSIVITEVLKRANVNSNEVSEVILGQVNKNIYITCHIFST